RPFALAVRLEERDLISALGNRLTANVRTDSYRGVLCEFSYLQFFLCLPACLQRRRAGFPMSSHRPGPGTPWCSTLAQSSACPYHPAARRRRRSFAISYRSRPRWTNRRSIVSPTGIPERHPIAGVRLRSPSISRRVFLGILPHAISRSCTLRFLTPWLRLGIASTPTNDDVRVWSKRPW